jgi:hypothetical protein
MAPSGMAGRSGSAATALGIELVASGRDEAPRTGPVASVYQAELSVPAEAVPRLLTASFLERVASAYRRFLGQVSLGFLRTRFGPGFESLVFLVPWPPLLRFHAPVYDEGPDWAEVRWDIDRGLLVARMGRGRGSLRIGIRRLEPAVESRANARMLARMEVAGYYPLIRGGGRLAGARTRLYAHTQARIHRRVMQGFLRSLATLELPSSSGQASMLGGRKGL